MSIVTKESNPELYNALFPKDENIKEILDYWKFYINEPSNYKLLNVHFDEIKKLLDYITNLQEENKRLKNKIIFNEKSRRKMQQSLMKEIERLKNQLDFIEEQNHIIDKLKKENEIIKSQLNICSQDLYMENLKLKLENERLKEENERLNNVINEANKCILEFIQTEDYNRVDGLAIADNYMRLMQILETKI